MLGKFYTLFLVMNSVVYQVNFNFQDVNNGISKDCPIIALINAVFCDQSINQSINELIYPW